MAIFSLDLGFTSRSEGKSAVGFGAYISGTKAYDQRAGIAYNYTNKQEVIVGGILAPADAPAWAKNPALLWNKVEAFEDHIAGLRFTGHPHDEAKNQKSMEAKERFLNTAQTAQTVMGAIPIELTKEQAEACAVEFLIKHFVSRNLVAHWGLHWDKGNPHFHAQVTRRPLIEGDFSRAKDRDIVTKAAVLQARKTWEEVANKHLALAGHEVRIDCRSHADRGSLFIATNHEGWYAQRLAEDGGYSRIVADNKAIREENIRILCDHPEALIQEVASKRMTFTRAHINQEIIRRVGGDETLFAILKAKVEGVEIDQDRVLSGDKNKDQTNLIYEGFADDVQSLAAKLTDKLLSNKQISHRVGRDMNDQLIYASKALKAQEDKITAYADTLNNRASKTVDESFIIQAIKEREISLKSSLSEEQKTAVYHLCSGSDIRLLNGNAGTGKTTLLQAVAAAYQQAGYRVLGTSFQGKAVEIMTHEIGIECRTVDSFRVAWEKMAEYEQILKTGSVWSAAYQEAARRIESLKKFQFTDADVIIVDEANMMGGKLWDCLMQQAADNGAKVLVVQDMAQIKSRDPGDFGRLFAEKFGTVSTTQVVRQRVDWQRKCSTAFNEHQVQDGLAPYYEKGHLFWRESQGQTLRALTDEYLKTYKQHPHQSLMALAYRNQDVEALNKRIHEGLKEAGILTKSFLLNAQEYALGSRIRFLENENSGKQVQTVTDWKHALESFAQDPLRALKTLMREEKTPIRLFSKFASGRGFVGESDRRTAVYKGVHEDSRTAATRKSSAEVEFPKKSIKGVKNGTLGTIIAYDRESHALTVRLDSPDAQALSRVVEFNPRIYKSFTHGYAMTIHKSEGSTYDRALAMADPLIDPHALLVAMTRHRLDVKMYINREQFIDFKDLVNKISYAQNKNNVYDYQVSPQDKPYFEAVARYKGLMQEAMTLREEMEASLKPDQPLYKHGSYKTYQDLYAEKKDVAAQILGDWQNHRGFVRLAGIRRDVLEVEIGLRPRLLSDLEYRASVQVQEYMDLSRSARQIWNEIALTHPPSFAIEHPQYQPYCLMKEDRNSLAAVFQENKRLYAPFFAVQEKEGQTLDYWGTPLNEGERIYWMGVESHAKTHAEAQAEKLYVERLTKSERETYDQLKDYIKHRNQAATLYAHLKQNPGTTEGLFAPESVSETQAKRDILAFTLLTGSQDLQPHFDRLRCKESDFLKHAMGGEVRVTLHAYGQALTPIARLEYARQLNAQVQSAKAFWILEGHPVTPHQLKVESILFERVTQGKFACPPDLDKFYKPFKLYKETAQAIGKIWHEEVAKIKERAEKEEPKQDNSSADSSVNAQSLAKILLPAKTETALQQLNQTRDYGAAQILKTTVQDEGLLRELGLSHEKLERYAQRFNLRQQLKGYAKKASIEERGKQAGPLLKNVENQKAYWMLKEQGLSIHLLKFDADFTKLVQEPTYAALYGQEKDQVYSSIRLYRESREQIASLLKTTKHIDARLIFEGLEYKNLSIVRDSRAAQVMSNSSAFAFYKTIMPHERMELIQTHALKHQAREEVQRFAVAATLVDRATLASQILSHTQQEQKQGQRLYIAAVKEQNVSFENLHLHEALLKHPQGINSFDVQQLGQTINAFVTAKEKFSRLWKEIINQTDLTDLKAQRAETLKTMRESLEQDLIDTRDKTYSMSVMDKWLLTLERQHEHIQRETREARKNIVATDDKAIIAEGLKDINLQHISNTEALAAKALKKEKLEGSVAILTQGLLELEQLKKEGFKATQATVKALGKGQELGALKVSRNEAATLLLKDAFIKEYIENHESFYVRRLAGFATSETKDINPHEKPQEGYAVPTAVKAKTATDDVPASSLKAARKTLSQTSFTRCNKVNLDTLKAQLPYVVDIKALAMHLIPNYRGQRNDELKFEGSIFVNLRKNAWMNFKENKSGGIKELITHFTGASSTLDVLRIASSYSFDYQFVEKVNALSRGEVKTYSQEELQAFQRQREERYATLQAGLEQHKTNKLAAIQTLYQLTRPIDGTPGEHYLRNVRGIQTAELPASLRFIPSGSSFVYEEKKRYVKDGALASIAFDSQGQPTAIQVTYLDKEGKRACNAQGEKLTKLTYGVQKGSFIELQKGDISQPIYLAEGVETALSTKEAGVQGSIYASLGTSNMRNFDAKAQGIESLGASVPKNMDAQSQESVTLNAGPKENSDTQSREIIILADWDGSPDHPAWKNTLATQKALQEQENAVSIALPVPNPGQNTDKVDFNDVLLKNGAEEVRTLVEKPLQTEELAALKDSEKALEVEKSTDHDSFVESMSSYLNSCFEDIKNAPNEEKKETLLENLRENLSDVKKLERLEDIKSFDSGLARKIKAFEKSETQSHSMGYSR